VGAQLPAETRKVGSYRTYLDGVSAAITDSAALGKQLDRLIANPTKFSRKQLIGTLDQLSAKQAEIAVRADRLKPPDTLKSEQAVFASGMRVRADGFKTPAHRSHGEPGQEDGEGGSAFRAGRVFRRTRRLLHGSLLHADA